MFAVGWLRTKANTLPTDRKRILLRTGHGFARPVYSIHVSLGNCGRDGLRTTLAQPCLHKYCHRRDLSTRSSHRFEQLRLSVICLACLGAQVEKYQKQVKYRGSYRDQEITKQIWGQIWPRLELRKTKGKVEELNPEERFRELLFGMEE